MKTLYIVRGLPGSGKSTYAKSLGIAHYEADMYFMRDGEYKFNPSSLKRAHAWCFNQVEDCMEEGKDVVVSNTFTTVNEIVDYVVLAGEHGYHVEVVEVKTSYGSVHNVPEATLAKMKARWQDTPAYLKVKVIK